MPVFADTRICSSGNRQFKDEMLESLFGLVLRWTQSLMQNIR